jgi:hypothetical protein
MPNRSNTEAMVSTESALVLPAGPARLSLAQWCGWLGFSAGATMLVGALAIWAATGTQVRPKAPREMEVPIRSQQAPTIHAEPATPSSAPPKPEPRRPKPVRPRQPPSVPVIGGGAVPCDGRDPLCGIDFSTVSDVGGKPHKPRPR